MRQKTAALYKVIPFFLISASAIVTLVGCGLIYFPDDNFNESGTVSALSDQSYSYRSNHSEGINEISADQYTVKEVIDGDTFILEDGIAVRLLGINSPEIDRYFYEEAKEALRYMVEGQKVQLERDISDADRYGRLLRYVFMGELFVNLEMVRRGFANVFTMAPDVRHHYELLEAERYAREDNTGLWEISRYCSADSTGQDTPGVIKIEIHADAAGNDMENPNGEYVVLSNDLGNEINVSGWTVKDSATSIYEFKNYVFSSNAKIILFSGSGYDGRGFFYWNSSMPVWNNDHDTLYLRDREGLLVGVLSY
ncbi:MAG: hypothetical protein FJW66_04545 [Actinobacteria bacterium]|nr:hypothetical protein [Actinomycetota bacterium]